MFVGTAMVATSVGIAARVLSGMGLLDAPTARIVLGAAVIDDILGVLSLEVFRSSSVIILCALVTLVEIATKGPLSSNQWTWDHQEYGPLDLRPSNESIQECPLLRRRFAHPQKARAVADAGKYR